jgi:hypothetical protein
VNDSDETPGKSSNPFFNAIPANGKIEFTTSRGLPFYFVTKFFNIYVSASLVS